MSEVIMYYSSIAGMIACLAMMAYGFLPALGSSLAGEVSRSGYLVGAGIIAFTLCMSLGDDIFADLLFMFTYGLIGLCLLIVSLRVNDRVILGSVDNAREKLESNHFGVASVEAASFVATATIFSASIYGDGGGLLLALAFFVVGQLFLIVAAWFYRQLVEGNLESDIEEKRFGSQFEMAGLLVGTGIVMGAALLGDFTGWTQDILFAVYTFAIWLVLVFAVLALSSRVRFRTGAKPAETLLSLRIFSSLVVSGIVLAGIL